LVGPRQEESIRKLTLLVLTAVLPLAATSAQAQQDPRLGSWTLTSAQSSLDPPDKLSVEPTPAGTHVLMSGETHLDFTAKPDGHDTAVPGNPAFDQVLLHRLGRQEELIEKKNGSVVATIHARLSNEGNELVVTTARIGHPDQIAVWTRTGAKVPKDPLAGDWIEDLSKTRMRQGLTLTIESDPAGGVRFTGDYSYSARFDGKPSDVRNSRNDTVSLQLVDSHTVDATFRRDNQVSQKDRWVVSADGRQMTLASTGTLETGQRFNEKLAFRKR
jgi:hypothetical protein